MLGWELPPHFAGGMGTVCYTLCDYLSRSGADIEFILPFEGDFSSIDFMKVNPVPDYTYEDLQHVHATTYGKFDISTEQAMHSGYAAVDAIQDAYIQKVAKVTVLGEYDVIHAHDWMTMRAGIIAKQISGLPLIVHVHATEFDRSGTVYEGRGNEMIHEIEYMGLSIADQVITVSQFTKDIIVDKYKVNPEKVQVVHNTIDLDSPYINGYRSTHQNEYRYLEEMKKRGYSVVVNVGRHTIQKGLTKLVEAAHLALQKNPRILFLFVGSGDQHLELIEMAADYKISQNVIFAGFQNGARLRDAFTVADLFVMPSVSEPFGITAIEAMGLGTPVLISHQSGASEVLQNALKVDFWDTHAMADKIVAVSENPSLHKELQSAGFAEFSSISWDGLANKTMNVYQSAVGAQS